MHSKPSGWWMAALGALIALASSSAYAGGRLLATGGGIPLAGAAGGGIVPWAVLSGYSADEEHGLTGAYTRVETADYTLDAYALSYDFYNRVELSASRQTFDIGSLTPALGFDPGDLKQDTFGVKVRLTGDAVFTRRPQVSVGMMHGKNTEYLIPSVVGSRRDSDNDFYVAATKVWLTGPLKHMALVNITLRSTRANQIGLLGFGGDLNDSRKTMFEMSAATFVNRKLAVGFEYRQKPNNLSFAKEDDWRDVFAAYFPNKHFAVVAAYADLGSIVLPHQSGFYLSFQGSR